MKTLSKYIIGLAALLGLTLGTASCQDDIKAPAVDVPKATLTPNLKIIELKKMFWQDGVANYADTIGLAYTEDGKPMFNPDGSRMYDDKDYIIHGRVISSDEAGNVFKSLIIQDETGALPLSINSYNLYLKYRRGQDIVLDLKGMYIGNYNGYMQLGKPEWYAAGSAYEVSFMSPEFFEKHVQLNGLPEVSKVDTLVVNSFADIPTNPDGLQYWQARLVRFCNVAFEEGGATTYSEYHSSGVNRVLLDCDGTAWNVRTSGYSNFWNKTLPQGRGDLVAICSYYGSAWQLVLLDEYAWFSEATIAPGGEDNPLTIGDAIAMEQDGVVKEGVWVTGYIVGTVAPELESITSDADIEWTATPTLGNTLVIGETPDTKSIDKALVIALPSGSDLRTYGALRENPDNYGKQIWLKGNLEKYMGTWGITGNAGTKKEFRIEGLDLGGTAVPEGDGTASKPYNATQATAQAIANGSSSTTNVYVAGYVVSGSIDSSYGSGKWYISNNPDGSGETFYLYGIYDFGNKKFTDTNKVKVGDLVVCCGPIYNYTSSYGSTPEMSKGFLYSLNGQTEGGQTPGGGDTPATGAGSKDQPYTVADIIGGSASGSDVWAEGYIVGWIDGQVYASGCKFNSSAQVATNIILAPSASDTDPDKCIPVQLPTGTVRSALNLKDNPGNYGKSVKLRGSIETYFGRNGLKSVTEYVLDGQSGGNTSTEGTPKGSGTAADPYNPTAAIAVAKANGETSTTDVYTGGYVVSGSIDTGYGNATFIVADNADGSGGNITLFRFKDFGGEAFTDADKIKKGDYVVVCAPLINFKGNTPETSYGSMYSLNGKTSDNGGGNTGGGETPTDDNKGQFNSFNGGVAKSSYGTYTNATGWTLTNGMVCSGQAEGVADQNPKFAFIGAPTTLAPTLDGIADAPGMLLSPTLTGGCGTLTFNYGFPFADTTGKLLVEVLQGDQVVKSQTIDVTSVQQKHAYDFSMAVDVKGDFVIRITNVSNDTTAKHKCRISVWNLTWTD